MTHEQLQPYEGEDAQAEDSKDHHVGKLLHWLEQRTNNGLQACRIWYRLLPWYITNIQYSWANNAKQSALSSKEHSHSFFFFSTIMYRKCHEMKVFHNYGMFY